MYSWRDRIISIVGKEKALIAITIIRKLSNSNLTSYWTLTTHHNLNKGTITWDTKYSFHNNSTNLITTATIILLTLNIISNYNHYSYKIYNQNFKPSYKLINSYWNLRNKSWFNWEKSNNLMKWQKIKRIKLLGWDWIVIGRLTGLCSHNLW